MTRKLLTIAVLLAILLSACTEKNTNVASADTAPIASATVVPVPASPQPSIAAPTPTPQPIFDEINGTGGLFAFGQTRDEVLDALVASNVEISNLTDVEYYSILDGGTHHLVHAGFYTFTFDKNDVLYDFCSWSAPTSMGLKRGDNIEKVKSLYSKYPEHEYQLSEEFMVLEYDINNHYFLVYFNYNSTNVGWWIVSRYSFDDLQIEADEIVELL